MMYVYCQMSPEADFILTRCMNNANSLSRAHTPLFCIQLILIDNVFAKNFATIFPFTKIPKKQKLFHKFIFVENPLKFNEKKSSCNNEKNSHKLNNGKATENQCQSKSSHRYYYWLRGHCSIAPNGNRKHFNQVHNQFVTINRAQWLCSVLVIICTRLLI